MARNNKTSVAKFIRNTESRYRAQYFADRLGIHPYYLIVDSATEDSFYIYVRT